MPQTALFLMAFAFSAAAAEPEAAKTYQVKTIQGWTVHVSDRLLAEHKDSTEKVLNLLDGQLAEIVKIVPAPAVEHLRKVPLWFSPEYPKISPRAEYHPDAGWLKSNGRDPAMARGVEFTNVRIYEREIRRMPLFVLHELAHAYHDQVLGFDQPEIVAAYKHARDAKTYDAVERRHGDPGRANTTERAYAMTNHKEYFAETTEAFFGENDFFPFNRAQLEKHDPEMFALLKKLWAAPTAPAK